MISSIVLFIGGPKNFQTEEMDHPPMYLQVPQQIKHFIGLGNPSQEDLQATYKVETYTLQKYHPGPTIISPLYVLSGIDYEPACRYAGEYFYNLMLNQHTIAKAAEKHGKSVLSMALTGVELHNQEWYQNAINTKPPSPEELKASIVKAMKLIEANPMIFSGDKPPTKKTTFSINQQISKLFPQLNTVRTTCPDCAMGEATVSLIIQHLNDVHKWPIATKIADWLETLDIKFEVKL